MNACENCGHKVSYAPHGRCPFCKVAYVPTDPAKFYLTQSEDQLVDDCVRTMDAKLYSSIVGLTACPHECEVDPIGVCVHGYRSVGARAGITSL